MRYVTHLSALALLCLFASQGKSQVGPCDGGEVCVSKVASADGQSAAVRRTPGVDNVERCPGLSVDVAADSADERRLVCSAAGEALQLLGRCHITLRRPLRVQVMLEVRRPFSGPIFGLFDVSLERTLVTKETNIPALVENTPYGNLPTRDFYRSLIVHEVVHGVMHQNLRRKATTHAAYEYPAYALQIEALPADVREIFLRSFDEAALKSDTLFNDSILFFSPYYFAARAYHHFKSAPDKCAHLTSVLTDTASFIAPM